jgi:hypothetical protein
MDIKKALNKKDLKRKRKAEKERQEKAASVAAE